MNRKSEIKRREMSRRYLLRQDLYGEVMEVVWTVRAILKYINEGRSSEWTDYDYSDWREGLREWTEWQLVREVRVAL